MTLKNAALLALIEHVLVSAIAPSYSNVALRVLGTQI
jgi:hypothetical protein